MSDAPDVLSDENELDGDAYDSAIDEEGDAPPEHPVLCGTKRVPPPGFISSNKSKGCNVLGLASTDLTGLVVDALKDGCASKTKKIMTAKTST